MGHGGPQHQLGHRPLSANKDVALSAGLLRRPAQAVARVVARRRLEHVLLEAARLQAGGWKSGDQDPEAVHDFRVALRRLRSWLRALGPALEDTLRKGTRKRLRLLSDAAGRVRDLEVQRDTLRKAGSGLHGPPSEAARWLQRRLEQEESLARGALGALLVNELTDTIARCEEDFRHYRLDVDVETRRAPPAAGVLLAAVLREHIATVQSALRNVRRPTQVVAAHRARIAVKRLRYLLDAFAPSYHPAAVAADYLGHVQDQLGDLHDAHLIIARARLPVRRRRHGRPVPGRAARGALGAVFRQRAARLFRTARAAIRAPAFGRAVASAESLARRLAAGRLWRAGYHMTSPSSSRGR